MLTELNKAQFKVAQPLFTRLAYNLAIAAVLEGTSPGRVWADDAVTPQSAFIYTVEGCALGGRPDNDKFNQALAILIRDDLFGKGTLRQDETEIDIRISAEWKDGLDDIAVALGRPSIPAPRHHYVCRRLKLTDWQNRLPDGFSVRRIDEDLLRGIEIEVPAHVRGWCKTNWGSLENYLKLGFGLCTIDKREKKVVSWSVADCISGDRCEIGIHTLPEYRRRGFASATAAAAVDHALARGFNQVGWHCDESNLGSIGVAEGVGFVKELDYSGNLHISDEGIHYVSYAYHLYLNSQFHACIEYLERALGLRDDYKFFTYHLAARAYAACSDTDAAMRNLSRAADLGETRWELTKDCQHLAALHDHPHWNEVLERITRNAIPSVDPA